MKEKTLIIIKPDAIKKRKIGAIISIFEFNNLNVDKIIIRKITNSEAIELYSEHTEHKLFDSLIKFMVSAEVCIAILKGNNAVSKVRKLAGNTNPKKAERNTIRFLFGTNYIKNAIHSSDSKKNAQREINIFFPTSP